MTLQKTWSVPRVSRLVAIAKADVQVSVIKKKKKKKSLV